MKKLLATTALAVGLVAVPGAASAQEGVVRVFGGLTSLDEDTLDTTIDGYYYQGSPAEVKADDGFVVGAAFGVSLGDFDLEAEVAYRSVDITEATFLHYYGMLEDVPVAGEGTAFSFMANAWYNVPLGEKFSLYAGGGVGVAQTELNFSYNYYYNSDVDSHDFAWQLGVGADFKVASGFSLGIGYRYFNIPEVGDSQLDVTSHDVIAVLSKRY
jgi:opacity protein-like surface antigen